MNRDGLFVEGDPFDDPAWQQVQPMVDAPPAPAKGYIACPLAWLARVRPAVASAVQLLILMLIYRRCLMARSRTVDLPNGELAQLGISRYAKYRALAQLREAGLVILEGRNGRSIRVTLAGFP
jgi:hypothetical protein